VTLRLFPPYGPADNERRLIPHAIKTLFSGESMKLTSGKQKWDFVYVGDIVDAYMRLLSKNVFPRKHEVFNIGSGEAVSVREVVSKIKEITKSKSKLEWGAVPHRASEVWFTCADVRKARKMLGWKPKTRILKDGLSKTVSGFKKQVGK
jgi:nucleoside-diphosphate-sugar epimerase